MSWEEQFVAAFDRMTNPMAGLREVTSTSTDVSAAELARCYARVVQPGETAVQVTNRLTGGLEVAAKEVDRIHTALVAIERAIVAAQMRTPPATIDDAGGILVTRDFAVKVAVDNPQYGSRPLTLGGVNSLPTGHWCRQVLDEDDFFKSGDGPCIFIGDGEVIQIREAVDATRRIRQIQRDAEFAYHREREQAEQRGRLQWEQSAFGQIHALRQEIKELREQQRQAAGA